MKKINYIPFVIVSLLLIMAGCQQKEIGQPDAPSNFLTATVENHVVTKSQLGSTDEGKYYAFWTAKDELAVYVDGLSHPDKYVLSLGAGAEKGVFAGTVAGNRYVALYPYSDRVQEGLKDNVLYLELPAVQAYSPESFGEGAFPMLSVSDGEDLPFKNLCAVLKVSMTGEVSVKSINFVAHDESMAVSGRATVRTDFSDAPELVMSEGGSPKVTLDCGGILLTDEPTDFYIVIPAGTYKGGFSVEVVTFAGTFTRSVNSDVTFARSQCRYIAPFRCDADGVIDPDDIPYNQIWYSTVDDNVFNPYVDAFDRKILSNTYKDGRGVIVFDGPVTKVDGNGYGVFNSNLITEVILPNSVETIGSLTFANSRIEDFHTPDNLKSFGERAFANCHGLTRIHGSLASADEKALVLPDGTLAAYAYGALEKDLTIPDGVKTVIADLFHGRNELETVTFPESVVSLGNRSFALCYSLKEFKGTNENVPDGHSFINPDGELAAFAGNGLVDYVIPDGVKYFQYWLFCDNETLHSITVPKLYFDNYSYASYFSGCKNLEFFYGEGATSDNHGLIINDEFLLAVTNVLPADYRMPVWDGVTRTGANLFQEIAGVERVTFPDGIKSLGPYTFVRMPDLKAVQMPAELMDMGYDTFFDTHGLDTLYLRSYAPPTYYEYNTISDFGHDGLVICVPAGYEDIYKTSTYWSKYAQYIQGYEYNDLPDLDYYISTDYSRDGEVVQLQKAKKGQGIDIVLMGDAFSDRQVEDGTYASMMNKMMEAFFSEEPYTSYRDLFNVYAVTVVSTTEGYDHAGQALAGWFGNGTAVGGNDTKCFEYARNVVSDDRMDNTLIIVAMNSTNYGGTCYMYYDYKGDYGRGASVAYFPIGSTDEGLAQLVHHEAGGHGFAKLCDEYAYEYMGEMPQEAIDSEMIMVPYGWWKNGDFTNDPAKVKWAHFLADERYQYDGLGCFEGAFTYWKGAWRPTENSIMRYNTGGFNAPSREAIWYRMHKLAYGDSWTYDYEEFVAYDAVNRKTAASSASPRRYAPEKPFTPTAPPVVTGKTWREAYYGAPSR